MQLAIREKRNFLQAGIRRQHRCILLQRSRTAPSIALDEELEAVRQGEEDGLARVFEQAELGHTMATEDSVKLQEIAKEVVKVQRPHLLYNYLKRLVCVLSLSPEANLTEETLLEVCGRSKEVAQFYLRQKDNAQLCAGLLECEFQLFSLWLEQERSLQLLNCVMGAVRLYLSVRGRANLQFVVFLLERVMRQAKSFESLFRFKGVALMVWHRLLQKPELNSAILRVMINLTYLHPCFSATLAQDHLFLSVCGELFGQAPDKDLELLFILCSNIVLDLSQPPVRTALVRTLIQLLTEKEQLGQGLRHEAITFVHTASKCTSLPHEMTITLLDKAMSWDLRSYELKLLLQICPEGSLNYESLRELAELRQFQ